MTDVASWPGQAEHWLDERGKPAWVVAMVLGFIVFWPIGLAILAYMIWGKKMFGAGNGTKARKWMKNSSGNLAFDAYKADTLRRLEDEQAAFGAFLQRLREAKDKAEFDAFMEDRARQRGTDTDAQG
jgi:hypothetical protein